MKKIWTLAIVTALGISTIGCEPAPTTTPATNKPMPTAPPAEDKEEKKDDEAKPAEGGETKPAEGAEKPAEGAEKPADAPK